jgi:hypothetical protein
MLPQAANIGAQGKQRPLLFLADASRERDHFV